METGLIAYVRAVDRVNDLIGRTTAWLILGAVLVAFAVVVMRKVFNLGFIWMQDLYVWQHAVVFMLGAGYTLLWNGHVRVDIFYSRASVRGRAWIDLLGTFIFLLPWLIVVAWTSLPFVVLSWRLFEPSPQPDGLPGVFLLKTVIIAFALLVALQGLALSARSVLVLLGREEFSPERQDQDVG
ncbi:MAG: TRAP transporter small permease subunit [Alphaproteobacteria bacterium]